MTGRVEDALSMAAQKLEEAAVVTPRLDAEVLMAHVLGKPRLDMLIDRHAVLSEEHLQSFESLLAQRLERRPLSHILGIKEFWSLDFEVTPAVLTPRPDSEILVAAIVERLKSSKQDAKILELGVGSGCLLISILHECTLASGMGVDISSEALAVAKRNMIRHELQARMELCAGDLFEPLDSTAQFDLILSNPPYIESSAIAELDPEVSRFEPLTALDGGPDGLDFYRRIIKEAPLYLEIDGLLALEIGYDQADRVSHLFGSLWQKAEVLQDMEGRDRVVISTLKAK
jgi:release factor glutamine methyltransferase